MPRIKEKEKIIHRPSTQEIFRCLSYMPGWSKVLLNNIEEKPYHVFLKWLIDRNFYKALEERITIKQIATDFKGEAIQITKWLHEIHKNILDLNFDRPELFKAEGIKVRLYMRHYDNYGNQFVYLPAIPRKFETFSFPFIHASMGTDSFWAKKVEHQLEDNNTEITIWLDGGSLNTYREFLLEKAQFHDQIGFMEIFTQHSFEIDKKLKQLYRN